MARRILILSIVFVTCAVTCAVNAQEAQPWAGIDGQCGFSREQNAVMCDAGYFAKEAKNCIEHWTAKTNCLRQKEYAEAVIRVDNQIIEATKYSKWWIPTSVIGGFVIGVITTWLVTR